MLTIANSVSTYHGVADVDRIGIWTEQTETTFSYEFENFYHPFIARLIQQLNDTSVAGMLDPQFLATLNVPYTTDEYAPQDAATVSVQLDPMDIDVSIGGPYANYNWELLYHIPVMVAVHLSNNQYYAEAQKWFHLVFDPTNTDAATPAPQRFWRSFVFNGSGAIDNINTLLTLLATPDAQLDGTQRKTKADVIMGYNAIVANPFQPHVVARTRTSAYQWYVVMKYLDNLIAWGDNLFRADTEETLVEASLCYVLAANLLGPRPQSMPQPATATPRNFIQLKQAGLDRMSNAIVELESQFPFNTAPASGRGAASADQSGALFGISRSLYFGIPPNPNLLGYWDTVADRLFKIRNSENIEGVAQQLPLWGAPLDPGMLVKAAAAGLDIGSIVSGLNQPTSPIRSTLLIQKALEIAGEVRALGSALLAACEKGDAESLALLRQGHEIQLQQMTQNVRYLQWQHAQQTTNGLLSTRAVTLERYTYYLRLVGQTPNQDTVLPEAFTPDRRELTEDNFDDAFAALVGQYDLPIAPLAYNQLRLAQGSSPSAQAGASGQGQLYLNQHEDSELNSNLPNARDARLTANIANAIGAGVRPIPSAEAHLAFWGLGVHSNLISGQTLSEIIKTGAEIANMVAAYNQDQAAIAGRTAGYERRVDDWTLQANLAAQELKQLGRQLLTSLISEQVAYHEYTTIRTQVANARSVQSFLESKFTSTELYQWMQSELTSLYYQYYRLAYDTARQAEQTMKRELMRPELDVTTFVQFNYWDAGHQGLLSGDALHLDVKRMEMAYHASNKRELELTAPVSLRQLDPLALVSLRLTGSCTVTVPEWLYDLRCPGHYLRRINMLEVSTPATVGPATSINLTVSLQSSTIRTSPDLANGAYARAKDQDDPRFLDSFGSTDVIVTSSGVRDPGMFERDVQDERFRPFEGAGAISTWNISLPSQLPAFDYTTISDVILHIHYTAREAGDPLGSQATKELQAMLDAAGQSSQALMLCLRFDFPTEWAAFVSGTGDFEATLKRLHFPYMVQPARKLTIDTLTLYAAGGQNAVASTSPLSPAALSAVSAGLSGSSGEAALSLPQDGSVLLRDATRQVYLIAQYHFGRA